MMKWQHDGRGKLAQIGVLTPHVDFVPESEFQAMAPDGISIHSARVLLGVIAPGGQISPKIGPDAVRAFAEPPFVDEAISLLSEAPLQVIVYAFTSSSYLLGAESDIAMKERLERRAARIPLVIPADAATLALKSLQCQRVALVHPPWFPTELDQLGANYFEKQGFEVVAHAAAESLRTDFGEIVPDELYQWTVNHVPATAEAVFMGGNGMRAIGVIDALEQKLGIPVLTANQVSMWQALQIAGVDERLVNYGQLFTH
ncbi:MAG: maleate cis-trans isomerase [Chloroflexota bacterium]